MRFDRRRDHETQIAHRIPDTLPGCRAERLHHEVSLPRKTRESLLKANPHIAQLEKILVSDHQPCRYLHEHRAMEPYRDNDGPRSTLHWGQRKLLIAELDFLLDHGHLFEAARPKHIVYAGAAGGNHIQILARLFPDILFHLFDNARFNGALCSFDNIFLYREFFTDDTARHFSKLSNLLFISDIRSATQAMEFSEFEARVDADNRAQLRWCHIMRPRQSLLKFRLPFDQDVYKYASGYVYLPVWGPKVTSETRIVPDLANTAIYGASYEDRMHYFNRYTRATYYRNMPDFAGLYCKCFDCSREIMTLTRLSSSTDSRTSIGGMCRHISKVLRGRPPVLA